MKRAEVKTLDKELNQHKLEIAPGLTGHTSHNQSTPRTVHVRVVEPSLLNEIVKSMATRLATSGQIRPGAVRTYLGN